MRTIRGVVSEPDDEAVAVGAEHVVNLFLGEVAVICAESLTAGNGRKERRVGCK